VYALTSAVVVHTVADKLTENNVKCASLDRSLLPEGQKWVGCSPDIHFSILFAKNFMDSRVDNENVKFRSFVQRNSEIGRLVSPLSLMCLSSHKGKALSTVNIKVKE